MSRHRPEIPSSDEEDADYNPVESSSNDSSSRQESSRNSKESADSSAPEKAVFEPHSPEYLPPASPSDDENSGDKRPTKKRRVMDSDEEDMGPQSPDAPASPDQEEEVEEGIHSPDEASDNATPDGDDEGVEAQTEEVVADEPDKEHDIIADIFGEDEEDEEFKGFKEAEEKGSSDESNDESARRPKLKVKFADKRREIIDETSKTSDEAGPSSAGLGLGADSDFDRLMNKRREEQRRRRKRSRGMRSGAKIVSVGNLDAEEREAMEAGVDDIVQDADEIAVQLVAKMAKAAEEDREVSKKGDLACKKLLLLPEAVDLISNVDFQPSMFDNGILGAITDWLFPLPDGSLPNIKLRTELLRIIQQFPPLNNDQLKDSGLGKAVMILCKHPKEIRANKTIARKLINEWARGIFNLNSQQNPEDREQQDLERLEEKKQRRLSSAGGSSDPSTSQPVAKRPGDPGWIYRARVPQLPGTDYIVKPEWKVSDAPKPARKEAVSRYEKHARNLKDRAAGAKKRYSAPSFIQFSIEGRKVL